MLELYKDDTFLKAYMLLTINEKINTKYIDFRSECYNTLRLYGEMHQVELLPKEDRDIFLIENYK